ncbi:MAG: ABC transporter permease [Candidatus Aminicenantaceae bacterium]
MKIYRNIRISRKALFSHKLRTFLALFGITIGVAAVIIMVAIGEGAQRAVIKQIEDMGTNLLVVNAGRVKAFAGRQRQSGIVTTLRIRDSEAIAQECSDVALAAPAQDRTQQVKYGNYSTITKIQGSSPDFQRVRNFPTILGRFFSEDENKASVRVAVIGSQVLDNLFEGSDPIGETIRIKKIPFEVIGVLKSKGVSVEGSNEDNQILIPINTALRRVFNLTYLNSIHVSVRNQRSMESAEKQIRELLRERHRLNLRNQPDDFTTQNQLTVLEAEKETSQTFTTMIVGVAAISLFVGGIGILAVMLLAVKERTHEIGLRMAVGSRRKDILVQFISEAVILGFWGGFLGVLLGAGSAWILGAATQWQTGISLAPIAISLVFSLSVGLLFGVFPARKASLLNPIDALRSE